MQCFHKPPALSLRSLSHIPDSRYTMRSREGDRGVGGDVRGMWFVGLDLDVRRDRDLLKRGGLVYRL